MTRAELPSQFASNGQERYGLHPKDRQLFVNRVHNAPIPDIDAVQAALPNVNAYYKQIAGMPPTDQRRLVEKLKEKLNNGTAEEQAEASNNILSISRAYNYLKEIGITENK